MTTNSISSEHIWALGAFAVVVILLASQLGPSSPKLDGRQKFSRRAGPDTDRATRSRDWSILSPFAMFGALFSGGHSANDTTTSDSGFEDSGADGGGDGGGK